MADRNLRIDLETNELNDQNIAFNMHKELHARRQDSFEDLLKQNKIDAKEFHRPNEANRGYANLLAGDHDLNPYEESDENLGENFESTPWVPPTIERAKEFKKKSIFRTGNARIDSVELVSAPDLGIGTSLYFQFAHTMTCVLLVMSFLALPELIFAYNGSAISTEDRDVLGLYKYMLGNIGYNTENKTYDENSKCTGTGYSPGEICLHINGNELSISEAASIITAMEFLQIVVFFVGVGYLYHKSVSIMGRAAKSSIAISDYTVMVTHIPSDTSDEEMVKHFSSLYQLKEPDFLNRPALEDARLVHDTDQSGGNPLTLNTWIAECVIHKGIGGFVSAFKSKQHILRKLYRARAKMKMYAENSPHSHGHNPVLFAKAEKEMLSIAAQMDSYAEEHFKRARLTFVPVDERGQALVKRTVSFPQSIYYDIQADSVAAFVTFEYVESLARCVRDYERYETFPMNLFYPEALKFRGRMIQVHRAAEPDQILWENIEIPAIQKFYLRIRTNGIAVILVVLCFIIILQASIYKTIFSSQIPSDELCHMTIPSVYANGSSASDFSLERPPESSRLSYDQQCESALPDTFYAVYAIDGNFNDPAVPYSLSACTDPDLGICPIYKAASFCPCVSVSSKTSCDTVACTTDGSSSSSCDSFHAGSIGSCYCYLELKGVISANGVARTVNRINDFGSGECREFFGQYALSVGLTYASVFTTIVVNFLLRKFLKGLAVQEAHTSSDAEQGSIMTKIFFSNYATMAIIVLVAYGRSDSKPAFFKAIRIFDGPYVDFTTAWYGNIGFYLMTTFILQSFSSLTINLLMYYVVHPLLRRYHHRRVAEGSSHSVVMQHDLNMLEVGPVFDPTDHTAQLLTLLFFTMTYGPGLPLLMPLCCFAFILYFRVDKVLLCRYYQKPPQVGDAAIRNVLTILPYAALVRLGFAIWMFGNQSILPTTATSSSSSYDKFLSHARSSSTGYSYSQDRIFRPNVFPLFVLFLVILAAIVIRRLWKELPVYWIYKGVRQLARLCFKSEDIFAAANSEGKIPAWELLKLDDPLRQQSAGLTQDYFRFVKHRDEIPDTCLKMFSYAYLTQMSEMEVEEGWKLEDRGDFVVKIKIWKEEHRRADGSKLRVGTLKRTYEVIGDHRCSSYNIELVPAYYLAMKGLREAASGQQGAVLALSTQKGLGLGMSGTGMTFLEEGRREREDGIDGLADLKAKPKKEPGSAGGGGGKAKVSVTVGEDPPHASGARPHSRGERERQTPDSLGAKAPKTNKTATSAQSSTSAATKKNFTFDDFEGMEAGQDTALALALQADQLALEAHQQAEEGGQAKAKKKGKKSKH